jgi:diketogulonate reductase-like aldo/keto reductase
MTLIDTAEMYASGGAELIVADAIQGRREQVFLVSKALPSNASHERLPAACNASLKRLRTDHIDLYLLHWRGRVQLAETVEAMVRLVESGKVGAWGVSNFDADDMQELVGIAGGERTATNQILYNLRRRGPEFDLMPWLAAHQVPTMAYSPVEQGGLVDDPHLAVIAGRHDATPAQVALAWTMRSGDVIAIPKASRLEHVSQNRMAADLELTQQDLAEIDALFPPSKHKKPLEMI